MRKINHKTIKYIIDFGEAENITNLDHKSIIDLYRRENGFTTLLYSTGSCGINGKIIQGNNSRNWYGITQRNANILIG